MISVQIKALKVHAEKFKSNYTYEIKEADDGNLDQKEEKNQLLNFQERMGKIILKLATLKISFRLNIQWMREEQYENLNSSMDNGTTETIKEIDKLYHIL